jgi:hypothetical protein
MACPAPRAGGRTPRKLSRRALILASVTLLCGCGSTSDPPLAVRAADPRAPAGAVIAAGTGDCAQLSVNTIGSIATRIYQDAASGSVIDQAVNRVRRSRSLVQAVESESPEATRRVLRHLSLGQIVRILVQRHSRTLASAGGTPALTPLTIPLLNDAGGQIATVTLSTQASRAFMETVAHLTGSQIVLFAGEHELTGTIKAHLTSSAVPQSGAFSLRGVTYRTFSLTGRSFPSSPVRIAILIPASAYSCGPSVAQTITNIVGSVGMRIYSGEFSGKKVRSIVARMERSQPFLEAVANRDPMATRNAIVGFFRSHSHVVRVRVIVGGKVLVDVGGPYVLAPVPGTLRSNGHVIAHFLTALQDDAGYMRLAQLFTGAEVLMRVGPKQVMGTLQPGPASVPDRGSVTYQGKVYQAFSFVARAFPSDPLRISLLVPTS